MSSFRRAQLRRAFRVVNGGTPTSEPNNWDGDVPWATPVDLGIFNGGIVRATGRSLSELGLASGSSAVPSGSLIVSTRAPIGYVAQVRERTAFNQGCRGLVPTETLDVRYFRYQLLAMAEVLQSRGQGSTFQELSSDGLAGSSIFLPSLADQRAIADYLDRETARIDTLIEKKRRLIELLDEHFLEQVRVRVTGGMRFSDPLNSRMNEITVNGWVPIKLAADLRFGSGTTPTAGIERYYGDGIPWIVTGNLRDKPVTRVPGSVTREALADFTALRVHPSGALVVAMYGATVGRLGITTCPVAVNQACCVMHSGIRINSWFLFYYLLAHREVLIERSVGAGQPNISQGILRSLRVPTPGAAEQERIVEDLDRARARTDQLYEQLRGQLDLVVEHRQALITAAVTGELVVPGMAA